MGAVTWFVVAWPGGGGGGGGVWGGAGAWLLHVVFGLERGEPRVVAAVEPCCGGAMGQVTNRCGLGLQYVHAPLAPLPARTRGCVQARCCCAGWGAAAVFDVGRSRASSARFRSGSTDVGPPGARPARTARPARSARRGATAPAVWRARRWRTRASVANRRMCPGRDNKNPWAKTPPARGRKRSTGPCPSSRAGARRWRHQTVHPKRALWCRAPDPPPECGLRGAPPVPAAAPAADAARTDGRREPRPARRQACANGWLG